jgi:hypothetical protein
MGQWKRGSRAGTEHQLFVSPSFPLVLTNSAIRDFLEISTCLRRLEMTVDSLTPRYAVLHIASFKLTCRPMTPTHHSLLHGLSTCLTYVKQRLTSSIEGCSKEDKPTWLKASSGLRDVRELLAVLCDIIQWVSPLPTCDSPLTISLWTRLNPFHSLHELHHS